MDTAQQKANATAGVLAAQQAIASGGATVEGQGREPTDVAIRTNEEISLKAARVRGNVQGRLIVDKQRRQISFEPKQSPDSIKVMRLSRDSRIHVYPHDEGQIFRFINCGVSSLTADGRKRPQGKPGQRLKPGTIEDVEFYVRFEKKMGAENLAAKAEFWDEMQGLAGDKLKEVPEKLEGDDVGVAFLTGKKGFGTST